MRADLYLVEKGYVPSRQRAKLLISQGGVLVDGKHVCKPAEEIDDLQTHTVLITDNQKFVGRGGQKLEGALDAFGIDPTGRVALDIGASTGGFTDCLLQRGAAHVIAVDAGVGQLAQKLRDDVRVRSIEHFNARNITPNDIGCTVSLIVMDVSFISATYIIPRFYDLLDESGEAICLIKPQFEVGKAMLGKGGIVKDAAAHRFAIERVLQSGSAGGLIPVGLIPSPIQGGDGNREFLIHFKKNAEHEMVLTEREIRRAVSG